MITDLSKGVPYTDPSANQSRAEFAKKPRAIPNLDKLSSKELVKALDHPSGWQRDMAQQLLVQRRDVATAAGIVATVDRRPPTRRAGLDPVPLPASIGLPGEARHLARR